MAYKKEDKTCYSEVPSEEEFETEADDDLEACCECGGTGKADHHAKGRKTDKKSGQNDAKSMLSEENAALKQRVDDLTNKYLMMAADFENYRKRSAKQMEESRKFALEPIVKDLIEVADNFERGILSTEKTGKIHDASLLEGLKNTHRQFMSILESYGVAKIPAEPGTEFDPHLHDSVIQVDTNDFPDGTIVNVFTPGYTLHSKVIRPASVSVANNI
ncbi:nucleotide exchange factor GrpE [Methanolapillus millepedarum]|uniref:Protein GrpE n=1 Tax=Methanolapillus millepedarum TaxID=3028296 RepID=A0AA96V3B6_9EURY|nr:Protein GrpE [Methanosarcinaceae archaeon Ac7]